MKLAEALLLRADLQKKLASLKARIGRFTRVQEGDAPAEDPNALISEALIVTRELHRLIAQIHRTNAKSQLPQGAPMLDTLIQRDALVEQHKVLMASLTQARQSEDRYSRREIRWMLHVSVPVLQQQADELAAQLRQLNVRIQEANWQLELLE